MILLVKSLQVVQICQRDQSSFLPDLDKQLNKNMNLACGWNRSVREHASFPNGGSHHVIDDIMA